jgi:hypothetical protein
VDSPRRTHEEQGRFLAKPQILRKHVRDIEAGKRNKTNLSHLSLLFRHGSQLMALRARFVGGLPSVLCSPDAPGVGDVLPRTTPAVVEDRAGFGRPTVAEGMVGWLSSVIIVRVGYRGRRREGSRKGIYQIKKEVNTQTCWTSCQCKSILFFSSVPGVLPPSPSLYRRRT